jgi:hypothetical protein
MEKELNERKIRKKGNRHSTGKREMNWKNKLVLK